MVEFADVEVGQGRTASQRADGQGGAVLEAVGAQVRGSAQVSPEPAKRAGPTVTARGAPCSRAS